MNCTRSEWAYRPIKLDKQHVQLFNHVLGKRFRNWLLVGCSWEKSTNQVVLVWEKPNKPQRIFRLYRKIHWGALFCLFLIWLKSDVKKLTPEEISQS